VDNPGGHVKKPFSIVCMPCFGRVDRKVDRMMDKRWTRITNGRLLPDRTLDYR